MFPSANAELRLVEKSRSNKIPKWILGNVLVFSVHRHLSSKIFIFYVAFAMFNKSLFIRYMFSNRIAYGIEYVVKDIINWLLSNFRENLLKIISIVIIIRIVTIRRQKAKNAIRSQTTSKRERKKRKLWILTSQVSRNNSSPTYDFKGGFSSLSFCASFLFFNFLSGKVRTGKASDEKITKTFFHAAFNLRNFSYPWDKREIYYKFN